MREIKFRAWYNKSQTWVYFDLQKGFGSDVALEIYRDLVLNGAAFYQYTGLKDKNGKEIYEGDIVRVYHRRGFYGDEGFYTEGTVEYSPAEFYINGDGYSITCHFHYNDKDREVIGNIYETKL